MNRVANDPIRKLLEPLDQAARGSKWLSAQPLSLSRPESDWDALPSYHFAGPAGGGDSIRIGIFAGIHGDEPSGSCAAIRFLDALTDLPELAQGYRLFVYPVCNPSGFRAGTRQAASGRDLNREFWLDSAEPEVRALEQEIRRHSFHGLISLHSDDTSDGVYGFVRGAVLTRDLLLPALKAAAQILPLNTRPVIDGFQAEGGIISQCYDGILASPPELLDPLPFEIIFETPFAAPQKLQEDAFIAALKSVLVEYRNLLAFAANL